MQRTSNYQLPQWEKEDRILMEDFNGAMANIESAIDGAKDEAKAGIAEAKNEASAAVAEAKAWAFSPENMPYALGTYKGNGSARSFSLGFRPKAVLISRPYAVGGPTNYATCVMQLAAEHYGGTEQILITDDGFELRHWSAVDDTMVNDADYTYVYVAFR